ncbi:hypothetical protein OG21DRAFT_1225999 [Imleria badia]|nr:hypothetical protein OG21DRAFT_1225999 [Imleria badia]
MSAPTSSMCGASTLKPNQESARKYSLFATDSEFGSLGPIKPQDWTISPLNGTSITRAHLRRICGACQNRVTRRRGIQRINKCNIEVNQSTPWRRGVGRQEKKNRVSHHLQDALAHPRRSSSCPHFDARQDCLEIRCAVCEIRTEWQTALEASRERSRGAYMGRTSPFSYQTRRQSRVGPRLGCLRIRVAHIGRLVRRDTRITLGRLC